MLVAAPLAAVVMGASDKTAHAGPLGTSIPANCAEHTSFSGGSDAAGDYRCAGLAIDFHVSGVAASQHQQWAGQWLFVDEAGQFRTGSCTFNRGTHPSILGPSSRVSQSFPNDPTGRETAYLTWRYGSTADALTAAALWVVFHYDAQDAAGTTESTHPSEPLIADLGRVSEMTGRQDLEDLAVALDAEATTFATPFLLSVSIDPSGSATATLTSAGAPVASAEVASVDDAGSVRSTALTDAGGVAHFNVELVTGVNTVRVIAGSPGAAWVYLGPAAAPNPRGAQSMITGGDPELLTASAVLEVVPPPTEPPPTEPPPTEPPPTTDAPTTTQPPTTLVEEATTTTTSTTPIVETTTMLEPTTTIAPTTTIVPTTTIAPTTTSEAPPMFLPPPPTQAPTTVAPPTQPPTTTTAAPTTMPPPVFVAVEPPPATTAETVASTTAPTIVETTTTMTPAVVQPKLPRTGGSSWFAAYLATALVVGGVGLIGTVRRRISEQGASRCS